jgi:hypothetical protein
VFYGDLNEKGSSSASSITQEFGWVVSHKMKAEQVIRNKIGGSNSENPFWCQIREHTIVGEDKN